MKSYTEQRNHYLDKALELRSSGLSYGRISKILSVPGETIRRWCIKFAEPKAGSQQSGMKREVNSEPESTDGTQEAPKDIQALEAEVERLRSALSEAEIKAEAYEELINVAESKFGIRIRKKAGAKQ